MPTERRTACAYKGQASYFSVAGYIDLAWAYAEPLDGATQVAGLIAFLDEKLEVFVDDRLRTRAPSPTAALFRDRFGIRPDH